MAEPTSVDLLDVIAFIRVVEAGSIATAASRLGIAKSIVSRRITRLEGFLGATLTRQVRPDDIEFLVITRWQSLDAIRGFAGDTIGRAVVEPGAIAALVDYDEFVEHYEVVEEVTPA